MNKFEDFTWSIRKRGQNLSTSTASRESSKKSYKIQKKIRKMFFFAFLAKLGNFQQKIIFQKILHGFLEDSLEAVEVDKF